MYLDGDLKSEIFSLTRESIRIQPKLTTLTTITTNSTQVIVCILKFSRDGFIVIKTYHSHSNSFHHSNVRSKTRLE